MPLALAILDQDVHSSVFSFLFFCKGLVGFVSFSYTALRESYRNTSGGSFSSLDGQCAPMQGGAGKRWK